MKTIYIFERGILGWQSIFGDWKQWPNEAVAWVNNRTPHKAQTLTYYTPAFLAAATRSRRARNFAELLRQYDQCEWRRVVVAHSEGTATALAALRSAGWPRVDELRLVCGACDSDFAANGLNAALSGGRVGRAFVYVAGEDRAMRLEDTYVGSALFGLQTAGTPLGLDGPRNMTPAAARLTDVVRWPRFGHSTCWQGASFARTMEALVGPAAK